MGKLGSWLSRPSCVLEVAGVAFAVMGASGSVGIRDSIKDMAREPDPLGSNPTSSTINNTILGKTLNLSLCLSFSYRK